MSKNPKLHEVLAVEKDLMNVAEKTTKEAIVTFTKKAHHFVGHFKTPAEAAEMIRKDPTANYRIFNGETHKVKVGVTAFMAGKNLQTLDEEWKVKTT